VTAAPVSAESRGGTSERAVGASGGVAAPCGDGGVLAETTISGGAAAAAVATGDGEPLLLLLLLLLLLELAVVVLEEMVLAAAETPAATGAEAGGGACCRANLRDMGIGGIGCISRYETVGGSNSGYLGGSREKFKVDERSIRLTSTPTPLSSKMLGPVTEHADRWSKTVSE